MILPDDELKDIFKHDRSLQKLISLPMLGIVYLFVLFAPDIIFSGAATGMIAFSAVAAFVCYSFIFTEDPSVHRKRVLACDVIQLAFLLVGLIAGNVTTVGIQLGMMTASNLANYFVHPILEGLYVLRNHPRYPFDNWRRDDAYASGVYTSGTYEEKAVKLIDNTMNAGKVRSVGGEEFFEGEAKRFEPPKPDPEKNLQQREQIWRSSDKETGYVLDNINKMYFDDGMEYGELTGRELEKKLMHETAPKKPPEPVPEDFFQQGEIVWRNGKDTPNAPVPEKRTQDGRTVLP